MRWFRNAVVALASAAAVGACADPTLVSPPDTSRAALFDALWHETDLTYSMFALKGVNWDSIGAAMRPRALAAPSDAAFAAILAQMLMSLRDRHVSFTAGPGASTIVYHAPSDYLPVSFDTTVVDRMYVTRAAASTPHLRIGWLAPGIGYIRIASFAGHDWDGEMDDALRALPNAERLVIDVRSNAGGTYQLAVAMAGRFTNASRTFGYVRVRSGPSHDDLTGFTPETVVPTGSARFTGPVYALTNRRVFSAAEDFALAMRALPNAVVVGDTTGGASGKPVVRTLANGWTYELSTWIEYTLDRRPVEDAGIAPSIVIAGGVPVMGTTAGIAAAKRDAVLDRVLQLSGVPLP
jgi:hypothetical protein